MSKSEQPMMVGFACPSLPRTKMHLFGCRKDTISDKMLETTITVGIRTSGTRTSRSVVMVCYVQNNHHELPGIKAYIRNKPLKMEVGSMILNSSTLKRTMQLVVREALLILEGIDRKCHCSCLFFFIKIFILFAAGQC